MAARDIESGAAAEGGTAEKQKLKKVAKNTPMEMLSAGVAAVSVGTSITAMVLNPALPVYVAGALSSVIGPYAYYQQTKLTDIIALKETHEAVKREVDRLTAENTRLNETVGELSDTIDRLEDVEQALDVITQTQGQSVAAFAEQVKENRNILGQMQKNLRANVLQNLLQVVIRSDQDDNMQIEEDEIEDLIQRIQKINGVEVREDRFKAAIMDSGGSLSAVMDIIKNLMADDVSDADEIFIIKESPDDM
jgi:cell division protein FtsB